MSRRPPLAALVAGLVCLASLAGCVGIPTSGPVQRGREGAVTEPGDAIPQANAPEPDATPTEIVTGFLTAGAAGLADEFAVAKQFLTPSAVATWLPETQVLIHAVEGGAPDPQLRTDGTVLVTVPVQAKVDSSFVYTEVVPGAREELVFELTQGADDQWRISQLEDGVVMSPSNFDVLYRKLPLYFASPDLHDLVPDLRWFPNQKTGTWAVSALLAGPSPWLRDGVRTGVEGARLEAPTVTVSQELEATVNLAPDVNVTSQGDIDLFQAQLEALLQPVPGVTSVEVQVAGRPWIPTDVPQMQRDVAPQTGPYMIQGDRLVVLESGQLTPVDDVASLAGLNANNPAISLDEEIRVVRSGTTGLLLLPRGGAPAVDLMTGLQLVAPSIDRFGWVWSGESTGGQLMAVDAATGEVVPVTVPFLQDRRVLSLRVSRDGARVAVVHASVSDDQDVVVDVAAVVRDEEGRPQLLGENPLQVGAVLDSAREVVWVDEATLAVLGRSDGGSVDMVHLVGVGGPTSALPLLDGTVSIAAGRGERAIYLVDMEGSLLSSRTGSWVLVATGVRDPVFPG
jgi:hypothetical protein